MFRVKLYRKTILIDIFYENSRCDAVYKANKKGKRGDHYFLHEVIPTADGKYTELQYVEILKV